jgi:uncharacterized membrane protein YgcG
MAWKGLFQHFEKLPMDVYHEFRHAHEIQIEKWQLYWSPNYVYITKGIVAPSGATTILNISSSNKSGSGSASGSGTTGSGGTTRGGGARASISTQGPLRVFNPVVEFFHEL